MCIAPTHSWSFLNDLLMSSLDTAVSLKQMHCVAEFVRKDLYLNMSASQKQQTTKYSIRTWEYVVVQATRYSQQPGTPSNRVHPATRYTQQPSTPSNQVHPATKYSQQPSAASNQVQWKLYTANLYIKDTILCTSAVHK